MEKADESMLKLAEKQKKEKEKLHKIYSELEKQLDAKHTLELEIERLKLKGAEGDDAELKKKLESIQHELGEKVEELDASEDMKMALLVKERITNDELQEARKELIGGLKDSYAANASIRVKTMGALDYKPFQIAAKRKYEGQRNWEEKALELCFLWEDHLRDASWYPFKVVAVGDRHEEIIDNDDERLNSLKDEFGDELYAAVITALKELNDYDPSGRCPVPELWNVKEGKRATMKEGVSFVLKKLKSQRLRR